MGASCELRVSDDRSGPIQSGDIGWVLLRRKFDLSDLLETPSRLELADFGILRYAAMLTCALAALTNTSFEYRQFFLTYGNVRRAGFVNQQTQARIREPSRLHGAVAPTLSMEPS
jgi:hypothetical protein